MTQLKGVRRGTFVPWLIFACILAAETPLLFAPSSTGDWFQFWFAGHLVWNHQPLYDPGSWVAASAYGSIAQNVLANCGDPSAAACLWLYPPWTAFLFAPFGALPLEPGIALLQVSLISSSIAACIAIARWYGLRGAPLAAALCLLVLSQPFVIGTRTGHPIGLLLIGALFVWKSRENAVVRFAIGTAIVALKPHVLIPTAVFASVQVIRTRAWHLAAAALSALALLAVAAAAAGQIPNADRLVASTGTKATLDVPTTWSLVRLIVPWIDAGPAWIATCLVFGWVAWAALRRTPPASKDRAALFVVPTLGLIVAPYAQTYDHFLALAPATCFALASWPAARLRQVGMLATLAALVLVLPWALHFARLAIGTQAPSALVPLALLWVLRVGRR